ncbi:fibronectin type III-like domain-contianing protein [Flavihumibacter rivuli]|uniref:fibronectin type III-like domain-contianing protein n=1 Tax=Flavihumibacter rivuli TaxID=2838156 RepID=UPI001EFA6E39|nr:fibronectin type III-like domain-contianing protein [Flavihumibacter rivuli]ULQ58439.1 fibronectin type III-like domain-contianing protein [Flavihumibacter rivuli]
MYIKDILASVARPVQELRGFQRIELAPGESRTVQFAITPEMLEMLDKDLKRVVEPGTFRIMIGSSSRDLWQKANLEVN